jgi:hypothetical protein
MKPADDVERSIKDLRMKTTAELDGRILTDALAALEQSGRAASETEPAVPFGGRVIPIARRPLWRAIMTSKWSKYGAAAAAIVIAVTATVTALHQSARPAYALEQTIEANRGVRYIHIRFGPPHAVLSETWAQIGENGEVLRLKMDLAHTEDGPKVVVWQGDMAEVWFKDKRIIGVDRDPNTAAGFPDMLNKFEPRRVVEELYQAQAAGRVSVETKMPSGSGEPITLTATSLPKPGRRSVYLIDPQSKLLQRRVGYAWDGQQYREESRWDFLDYNQEPAGDTFTLGAPADTVRIDATTQVIGLPKGDLSDEQITVQLAREFFEALIANDYGKAGQLLSGLPASRVPEILEQLGWGGMKFVRIVSIGEPRPQPVPGVGGTEVVCQVEVEVDGVKAIKSFTLAMRPASMSQPDRWAIHGGE